MTVEITQEEWNKLLERLDHVERTLEILKQEESREPWHSVLDWTQETSHPPGELGGFVLDDGVARSTPCECIKLSSGSELCFSKGIVGALSPEQIELYCPEKDVRQASPEQEKRIEIFKRAAETCSRETQGIQEPEQRFGARLACMKRELAKWS